MSQKSQKGSLLIEVLAVIALIALITPVLFRQVKRRNEEILDAQYATELRTLKDATSAYLLANESTLAYECALTDDQGVASANADNDCDELGADASDFNAYLPPSGTSYQDQYYFHLYGKTVLVNEETNTYRPVLYALIVQKDPMPNLRRASRVASMVGVEGGILRGNTIEGVGGTWSLTAPNGLSENAVAAITSFDQASGGAAVLKDVRWDNLQTTTANADAATTKRMGITEALSISADSANCITQVGTKTVVINGTTANCTPVFEVDAANETIRIAKPILAGANATRTNCPADKVNCEKTAGCIWKGDATTGSCSSEYLLDPANTSVMNDVMLSSRGNAKLSDLLPKYSLQDTYHFRAGDTTWSRTIPVCSEPLKTVVMAIPTLEKAPVSSNVDPDNDSMTSIASEYQDNMDKLKNLRLRVKIGSTTGSSLPTQITSTALTLTPQYCTRSNCSSESNWSNGKNNISVLLNTYCLDCSAINSQSTCTNAGCSWNNSKCE